MGFVALIIIPAPPSVLNFSIILGGTLSRNIFTRGRLAHECLGGKCALRAKQRRGRLLPFSSHIFTRSKNLIFRILSGAYQDAGICSLCPFSVHASDNGIITKRIYLDLIFFLKNTFRKKR
jgi:hypothetical protein